MILCSTAPAVKADRSSDSSHWYQHGPTGWQPLYTPEKNYTLREARKDQLAGAVVVPSVTTYFKCLHKQALLDWKCEQTASAAYDLAQEATNRGWLVKEAFIEAACDRADNASRPAADLGTRIHAADEDAHAGKDIDAALAVYVDALMAVRKELKIETIAREVCCGSRQLGYAGKCDEQAAGMTVLDIKSRKSGKQKTPKVACYSTDRMQLAAYGFALYGSSFFVEGRGIILGASTTTPGLVTPHVFTGAELYPAFTAFRGLTDVWIYENSFQPRVAESLT